MWSRCSQFDRLDAQVKSFGDLAGPLALTDQLEDFEFAIGQPFDGRPICFRPAAGKDLKDFALTFYR